MTGASDNSVFAIDIGGTKIAIARVEGQNAFDRFQIATPRSGKGDDLVSAIKGEFRRLNWHGTKIAIATTGLVMDGRVTALNPSTLQIENFYPLAERIEERMGSRPIIVNDAQAAAWGEYLYGAGQGARNFAYITVSTGVGAGIIAEGRLLTGAKGLAGHLGHMTFDPSGELCGCGRRGCVEMLASGTAISKRGSQMLNSAISAPEVFDLAKGGNLTARTILKAAASAVSESIANLAAIFDVDIVALGGGVGLAPGFRELVVEEHARLPDRFQRSIVTAQIGADAGLIGAAAIYGENFH